MSSSSTDRVAADLHAVTTRLEEHYAPDEAKSWLRAAHPQLAGASAIDLIEQDRTAEVLRVIDRLEAGAFV